MTTSTDKEAEIEVSDSVISESIVNIDQSTTNIVNQSPETDSPGFTMPLSDKISQILSLKLKKVLVK